MRYKAVIFDLDGVICSTDLYHFQAWKELADYLGIYFDEEINRRLRGVSRMDSLEILLGLCDKSYDAEQKNALAQSKNIIYRDLLGRMSPEDLPRNVMETLCALREKGLKLAIGSSSKNAPLILKKLGLDGFFDAVADGTQVSRSKPDPEVFLLAADKLGLKPEDCLVVEDAEAGVRAASAGCFDAAFLGEGAGGADAAFRVQSLEEITGIVTGDGAERLGV